MKKYIPTTQPQATTFIIIALSLLLGASIIFSFLEHLDKISAEQEIVLVQIECNQSKAELYIGIANRDNKIAELYQSNERYRADSISQAEAFATLTNRFDSLSIVYADSSKIKQDSINFLKTEFIKGYRAGESHAYDIMSKRLLRLEQQRQVSLQKTATNQSSIFNFPSNSKIEAIIRVLSPNKERDNWEVLFIFIMILGLLFILVNKSLPIFCRFIDKHRF